MLNDLKELIAIKSVLSEGDMTKAAPFGLGNRQALDWFLNRAGEYGLKTGELDGYVGWAEYGDGEECVAALCHLDVVPAGDGWLTDPFALVQKDGYLYGRGVADNKGSAILCLHALKQIKESGLKTKHRLRLIVGLNEEHGSACIKHLMKNGKKEDIPFISFVPDSAFPLINSEKGILHMSVKVPLDEFFSENIAFIEGGQSINVIPDKAGVSIFKDSELGKAIDNLNNGEINSKFFSSSLLAGGILASGAGLDDFSIKNETQVYTIEAVGLAGHAMAPEKGDNAIWKIVTILDTIATASPVAGVLKNYFCNTKAADNLGIYKEDKESGELTMNIGIIEFDDDNYLRFTMDVRLPISAKYEDVKKRVEEVLPRGSRVEVLRYAPNLFVSEDDDLIKTLLKVYEDKTGKKGYCIKTGGGTYARDLPKAVAFGPVGEDIETNLHKAQENMSVKDFETAFEVYKAAFIELGK